MESIIVSSTERNVKGEVLQKLPVMRIDGVQERIEDHPSVQVGEPEFLPVDLFRHGFMYSSGSTHEPKDGAIIFELALVLVACDTISPSGQVWPQFDELVRSHSR